MQTPNFRAFQNAEFINFNKDVVTTCNTYAVETLKIKTQVAALDNAVKELSAIYVLDRGSDVTDLLQSLDLRRDNALAGLRLNADSFTRHFSPSKKAAGEILVAGIDKYGDNLARKNYIAETQVISGIVKDTHDGAAVEAAVTTLGLVDWFTELDTANKLFNAAYLDRNAEIAGKPSEKMPELRVATVAAYTTLIKHIEANNLLTPNDDYATLINKIDALISKYNEVTAKHVDSKDEEVKTGIAAGSGGGAGSSGGGK